MVMATAIVVEDDALTRLSLVSALERAGVTVVANTGTSAEAIDLSKKHRPMFALLDLHLGAGPTGIDVAHAFRRLNPAIGIIFLTSYQDPRLLHGKLPPIPAGSVYLVKKDVDSLDSLMNAIGLALKPKRPAAASSAVSTVAKLTDSQVEVLKLVAQGLTNAEIAKLRNIRESSVEVAISRITKSLNLGQDTAKNHRVHLAKVYFRAIGAPVDD